MIFTHTSNPSIDYYLELSNDLTSGVQRAVSSTCLAGGKGLNVSMVLNQMKIASVATAFLGGFSGDFIRREMTRYPHIHLDAVEIGSMNRINVKIRGQQETDINVPGPVIRRDDQLILLEKLKDLKKNDWLLICGSLAQQVDQEFLVRAAQIAHQRSARLVLDVPGITAQTAARCQPQLIKPNFEELYAMFDLKPDCGIVPQKLIERLLSMKVGSILLSNGEWGADYYQVCGHWKVTHPQLQAINTVGSGDSMLAGFVGSLDRGCGIEEALMWAAAAGEATAISSGLADYQKITQLRNNVKVSRN